MSHGRRRATRMIAALAVAAVLLGGVAVAASLTLVSPRGTPLSPTWQRWAQASIVPTVGGRVTVHLTGCPAMPRAAGCVYNRRTHSVYLRRGVRDIRSVLLHELGHLYDLRVMNNRDRGRFRRIFNQPRRRSWWKGRVPLAEQFAEAYSFCARYRRIVSIARYSSYRYRPTRAQHAAVCDLVRDAARDRAPSAPPANPPAVTNPHPVPPPQPPPNSVPNGPEPAPKPTPTPTPGPGGGVPTPPAPPPIPYPLPLPRAG